MECGVGTKN